MRRLPVFLVIDVSESMAGTAIENVKQGIHDLTEALMSDPYALETAYLSVITFAGTAKTVMPLTGLLDFHVPDLSIGAGTSLSAALSVLDREIENNVKKNTASCKGDWRPLVFLLTDGSPTDNCQAAIAKWKAKYSSKVVPAAVLMGEDSNASALASLTDNILVFKDSSPASYKEFFRWVSSSIQTSSKEIGDTGNQTFKEKMLRNLEKDLLAETIPAQNRREYIAVPARCVKDRRLYIVRAVRHNHENQFHYDGSYPVDECYFELSGCGEKAVTVSSDKIAGFKPSCPYCGNRFFGQCTCGKCLCMHSVSDRRVKCPWCGSINDYSPGNLKIGGGKD